MTREKRADSLNMNSAASIKNYTNNIPNLNNIHNPFSINNINSLDSSNIKFP